MSKSRRARRERDQAAARTRKKAHVKDGAEATSPVLPRATKREPERGAAPPPTSPDREDDESRRSLLSERILRGAWWLLLAAAAAAMLLIRIRLLEIPLERDEGEYAYAGQLLLAGVPPYELAYNMKFPGTYAAYATIMGLFGQSIAAIHFGLVLVNLATIALVFLLGRRLLTVAAGLAAAASYAILSVSPAVLGFAGHATHFVILPVLGGLLLLLRPERVVTYQIFASGILFGLGVLMKQPGIFFIPFGAGCLLQRDWRDRLPWKATLVRTAIFLGSAALPLATTFLLLWWAGVFDKFWFWTVVYAREYGGLITFSKGSEIFLSAIQRVAAPGWTVWAFAGLGTFACLWDRTLRRKGIVLLGFLVFSAFAVSPGFYFRRHYFILALPAICLLAGALVAWAENFRFSLFRFATWLLFAAGLAWAVFAEKAFFFAPDPAAASRLAYGSNPFPEAVRVARFLRERAAPEDKIAVLGSEPQIPFYAQRRSATGYLYLYGLMEPQRHALQMQREMIQEIEAAAPKYIVLVAVYASWLGQPGSERLIADWMHKYLADNFRVIGLADMVSAERTDYYLPASAQATATSEHSVVVYERK